MTRHSSEASAVHRGPAHEFAAAQSASPAASVPRGIIHEPVPAAGEHELGELLRRLGYHPSDRISVNHKRGSDLVPELVSVDRAPETAARWTDGDVWFGAGPLAATVTRGRGTARDVVGLRTVACDLDYGPDKAGDKANVGAITEELSAQLGSRPTANVHSGHGQQPHWAVAQDEDTSWPDADDPRHARATAALAGVKALVGSVARQHGAKVDAVFDMARIWRVPGTVNGKVPAVPVPTTVEYPEGSRPLTLAELEAACTTVTQAEPTAKARAPRAAKVDKADEAESYDDLDAALQVRVDRWVDAAVTGVDADLHAARDWPAGHRDDRERGWDKVAADGAHRYGALYRAPWNGLTMQSARTAFLAACPTDDGFTAQDARRKWDEQHRRADPAPWPSALYEPEASVTFMSGKHQQPPTGEDDEQVASKGSAYVPLDDRRLAKRISRDTLAGRYLYSEALGWLHYVRGVWTPAEDAAVQEAVARALEQLYWQAHAPAVASGNTKLAHELLGLLSIAKTAAVVKFCRGLLLTNAAAFDQHPDLLNVGNGVVDLRTGALLPHDPALLLAKITPVHYDSDAEHEDWTAALGAVAPEVEPYLRDRLGQGATGHPPPDDVAPVAYGIGSNGKTALFNAVKRALGQHAVIVSPRVLLASPDEVGGTEVAELRGARFTLLEELPESRLSVVRLKTLIGTPEITARRLYKDPVTWTTTHSPFITSNYRPTVVETDDGAWRRLALVTFGFRFRKPHEPLDGPMDRTGDPGLRDRLTADPAVQRAVLRWLVDGAVAWYARGRQMVEPPAAVVEATAAWRREEDPILGYCADRIVFDPARHIPTSDLLADFNEWLVVARGQHTWNDKTLGARFGDHSSVRSRGVEKSRERGGPGMSRPFALPCSPPAERYRAWAGVRFRTAEDEAWDRWDSSQKLPHEAGSYSKFPGPVPPVPAPSAEREDQADAPF